MDCRSSYRRLPLGRSSASPDSWSRRSLWSSLYFTAFAQWGSEIALRRHARRGRTGTLSGWSDRYAANHSTTSSCSAKRTCALSWRLTLRTTMRSGLISHWTKMLQIFAGRRRSAVSRRYRSSAGSIINTSGFRFWTGTTGLKSVIREPRNAEPFAGAGWRWSNSAWA